MAGAWVVLGLVVLLGPLAAGASSFTLVQLDDILAMVMVVVGLNVVTGFAGQLSLGPSAIFAVAGYSAAVVADHSVLGANLAVMALVGVVAAGVVGLVLAVPALRVSGFYLGMTTLLVAAVVPVVAQNLSLTGKSGGILLIADPMFHQTPSGGALYVLGAAVVLALLGASAALRATRLGRRFATLRSSDELTSALGQSVYRTKLLAFVVSAVPAGLGGVFYVYTQQIMSPGSASVNLSIYLLAAAVIGGFGTVLGPLVGGAVVFGLNQFLGGLAQYEGIVYGVLLVVVVATLPEGVVGGSHRLRQILPRAPGRGGLVGWASGQLARDRPLPTGGAGMGSASLAGPVAPSGLASRSTSSTIEHPAKTAGGGFGDLSRRGPGDIAVTLQLRGVRKIFGAVVALDGLDIDVTAGRIRALIGPNGSGKTTTINLVTGFYQLDGGSILLDGRHLEGLSPADVARAGVVRTFQTPKLLLDRTVLDNVMVSADLAHRGSGLVAMLPLRAGRRTELASSQAATACLEAVGIESYASASAGELPHGIQRLVEVARALAASPRFVLLDEPAAGLTPAETDRLSQVVRAMASAGIGVLLVEHNVPVVLGLADDVTVLHEGRSIFDGPPSAVHANAEVARVFLGSTRQPPPPALAGSGAP